MFFFASARTRDYNIFSCSTQPSLTFQQFIKAKMLKTRLFLPSISEFVFNEQIMTDTYKQENALSSSVRIRTKRNTSQNWDLTHTRTRTHVRTHADRVTTELKQQKMLYKMYDSDMHSLSNTAVKHFISFVVVASKLRNNVSCN